MILHGRLEKMGMPSKIWLETGMNTTTGLSRSRRQRRLLPCSPRTIRPRSGFAARTSPRRWFFALKSMVGGCTLAANLECHRCKLGVLKQPKLLGCEPVINDLFVADLGPNNVVEEVLARRNWHDGSYRIAVSLAESKPDPVVTPFAKNSPLLFVDKCDLIFLR